MKPPIPIARTCPLIEQLFQPGQAVSFCSQCQHHVHQMSVMTPIERRKLIKRYRAGEKVCVAYYLDERGRMLDSNPRQPGRIRKLLLAVLPLSIASCSSIKPPPTEPFSLPTCSVAPSPDKAPIGKAPIGIGGVPPPPPPTFWERVKGLFE